MFPWKWRELTQWACWPWSCRVSVVGNGECQGGRCHCFSGWEGDRCQCPAALAQHCVNSKGQVCSGRGTCVCGRCECTDPRSIGRLCEHCPACHLSCNENWYVLSPPWTKQSCWKLLSAFLNLSCWILSYYHSKTMMMMMIKKTEWDILRIRILKFLSLASKLLWKN